MAAPGGAAGAGAAAPAAAALHHFFLPADESDLDCIVELKLPAAAAAADAAEDRPAKRRRLDAEVGAAQEPQGATAAAGPEAAGAVEAAADAAAVTDEAAEAAAAAAAGSSERDAGQPAGAAAAQRCPSASLDGDEQAAAAAAAPGSGEPGTGPAAEASPAASPEVVELHACTVLLKQMSPKFKEQFKRWSEEGAPRRLVFECRDGEEVESYRHLLEFVHSGGQQLPTDLEAMARLLVLAREHLVEPCVMACLQHLRGKRSELSPGTCLLLLHALETGASEHSAIQDAADGLRTAAGRAMLRYLGRLEGMMDSDARRDVFTRLPFEFINEHVFKEAGVVADSESTVVVAFAVWGNANIRQTEGDRARVAEVFSRIRFPKVPIHLLAQLYAACGFLRWYDPDRSLLTAVAQAQLLPELIGVWIRQTKRVSSVRQSSPAFAACAIWEKPRVPDVASIPPPVTLQYQVPRPVEHALETVTQGSARYYGGYCWNVSLKNNDGRLGLGLKVLSCLSSAGEGPQMACFGPKINFTIWLKQGTDNMTRVFRSKGAYALMGNRYHLGPLLVDGREVKWEDFWSPGAGFLRSGAAHFNLDIEMLS